MNTVTQAQLPAFQPVTRTNGPLTVSEHIETVIGQLVRSGALDSAISESLAIRSLATACRLTLLQAAYQWVGYAAKYNATLVR